MSTWRGLWPVESLVKAESVWVGKMYEHVCNQICFQAYQERQIFHSRSFLLVGPARIWDLEFGDDAKLAFLRRSIR